MTTAACFDARIVTNDPDLDRALALETRVWQALAEGDGVADCELLAEDFLGVYPSGFSDRAGHVGQLDDGPTVVEYSLRSATGRTLGDAYVLSYEAHFRRRAEGPLERMYVSSIWQQVGERWLNVFSQDTPVE